jgi:hypothetical protein
MKALMRPSAPFLNVPAWNGFHSQRWKAPKARPLCATNLVLANEVVACAGQVWEIGAASPASPDGSAGIESDEVALFSVDACLDQRVHELPPAKLARLQDRAKLALEAGRLVAVGGFDESAQTGRTGLGL